MTADCVMKFFIDGFPVSITGTFRSLYFDSSSITLSIELSGATVGASFPIPLSITTPPATAAPTAAAASPATASGPVAPSASAPSAPAAPVVTPAAAADVADKAAAAISAFCSTQSIIAE
ncbi:hypothetical protein MIMGU_mgv1a016488mg [Erythranthe guttata]|uniref:Uncharacterized protein n=1 Tax=Erythranthe guttata TaxID=4155 RepID=A0A022Q3C3_ERYGU|nr:hypothetical protein MIMGU_mgv1a016488mg [Erythranthe guttata]